MGIEPTRLAWEARTLPLSYTRDNIILVERGGFEPPKALPTDLQSAPFGQLGYLSIFLNCSIMVILLGADDGSRTRNLLITNQLLCH